MLTMIQLMVEPGQALTCGQVDASLAPSDRRVACNCVKAAANRYANLKDNASQALPNKCRITLDIPVSRSINCDMTSLHLWAQMLLWHHAFHTLLKELSQVQLAEVGYANLKDDAAQALPSKCGFTMDIPVSINVNCDA
ncbi:hypothetical protein HAX54_047079 [Datura stramonium]|uniref:Non-specific lipid-transfer protein n=1 Tax=Datura stramonium TaxID=4076 RepID=A0ABS8WJQ2_DATST|nr:hypothetical protein [Datura stramonium]